MTDASAPLPEALSANRAKGAQLEEILEGIVAERRPGARLPSERQLADRFNVARMTVRGAVDALIARGMVYRAQGQGTFVAHPRLGPPEALTSFTEEMRRRGLRPGAVVLAREVVSAPVLVAQALGIRQGARVVRFDRLRTADGEPMALERAYLPLQRFPGLDELDLTDASLYDELRRRWDVDVHHAEQRGEAMNLDEEDASHLGVEPRMPGFRFRRVTRDAAGRGIEYSESRYRGDRYEVRTQLHRAALTNEQANASRQDPT